MCISKISRFPSTAWRTRYYTSNSKKELSSDSTGLTANMNNAVTQLETQSIKDNTDNHVDTDLTNDTVIDISLDRVPTGL